MLSSAAALAMTVVVLREQGLGPWATATGVTVMATSEMFLADGTMLDTPVTSLPFSLAALWVAMRIHHRRSVPVWAAFAIAAAAALSGWQSTTFCGVALLYLTWRSRHDQEVRPVALASDAGLVVGLATDLLWARWA